MKRKYEEDPNDNSVYKVARCYNLNASYLLVWQLVYPFLRQEVEKTFEELDIKHFTWFNHLTPYTFSKEKDIVCFCKFPNQVIPLFFLQCGTCKKLKQECHDRLAELKRVAK